jgi:hypothetical protein
VPDTQHAPPGIRGIPDARTYLSRLEEARRPHPAVHGRPEDRSQLFGAAHISGTRAMGGGWDRDELIEHVGVETAYAHKLGVKVNRPAIVDIAAIEERREAIAAVVGAPWDGSPVVPNG